VSLQINNLAKSYAARSLFSNVTFFVNQGECTALVGHNGSGKSTLMKIIMGFEHADDGNITMPKQARAGYLPQEIFLDDAATHPSGELTLFETVAEAFDDLKDIKASIDELEKQLGANPSDTKLYAEHHKLLEEFEYKGGYTWRSQAVRVLKGLGFPEERFDEPLKNFSGGKQMRAHFAKLLLSKPDYLLLDEPTNYLDIESIGFLEEFLKGYRGGILVVSHDRMFLDNLASYVVALTPDGAKTFKGNYSDFLEASRQWAEDAEKERKRQDKEIAKTEKFIERFRYKASKASQVQSRIKSLEKIQQIRRPRALPKPNFKFPECEPSGETVLTGESISRSFAELDVLKDISFRVEKGDRLAIVGENGAGKSTLMRILASEDRGFSGSLIPGYRVFPAYFAQDEEISFEGDETIEERIMRDAPLDAVPEVRNLLGALLFSGDDLKKKVSYLSGGEKSRLGLARLLLRPSNLLLLDEPTNHLDIDSREALLSSLEDYPGTIVIVSHDRFFLDEIATKVLAIRDGEAELYMGSYSDYLAARKRRDEFYANDEAAAAQSSSSQEAEADSQKTAQELYKETKRLSNRVGRLERDIADAEEDIQKAEEALAELENELASPKKASDTDYLVKLSEKYDLASKHLEQKMSAWEELNLEYEETKEALQKLKS